MRTIYEIIKLTEIAVEKSIIEEWIELGWLKPVVKKHTYYFEEVDIARIQLINELHSNMMIEQDAIPVVLSLLDHLYGTRAKMRELIKVIEKQPDQVQSDIFSLLDDKYCK